MWQQQRRFRIEQRFFFPVRPGHYWTGDRNAGAGCFFSMGNLWIYSTLLPRAILVIQIPHYFFILPVQKKKPQMWSSTHTRPIQQKSNSSGNRSFLRSLVFNSKETTTTTTTSTVYQNDVNQSIDFSTKERRIWVTTRWICGCRFVSYWMAWMWFYPAMNTKKRKKGKSVSQIYFSIITERPFW